MSEFDPDAFLLQVDAGSGSVQPQQSKQPVVNPQMPPSTSVFNPDEFLSKMSETELVSKAKPVDQFDPDAFLAQVENESKPEELISKGSGQKTEAVQVGLDGTLKGTQSPMKKAMSLPKDLPPSQTVMEARPGSIPDGEGSKVLVTLVKDGDTFDFDPQGSGTVPNAVPDPRTGKYTCRIDSIDTPEVDHSYPPKGIYKPGQPGGKEAGKALEELIANKQVTIRIANGDKTHNRNVCQVEIEGVGVDHEMVKNGLAWVIENAKQFADGPRLKQLRGLHQDALRNQTGVFGMDGGAWEPSRWRDQKWPPYSSDK